MWDIDPHEGKIISMKAYFPLLLRLQVTLWMVCIFCSRWNLSLECSTDSLALASESTGSHEQVGGGSFRRW